MMSLSELDNLIWKLDVQRFYRYKKLLEDPYCSEKFATFCQERMKELQEKYPTVKF